MTIHYSIFISGEEEEERQMGDVDLNEGGKLENKRQEDDEDRDGETNMKEGNEKIETEGAEVIGEDKLKATDENERRHQKGEMDGTEGDELSDSESDEGDGDVDENGNDGLKQEVKIAKGEKDINENDELEMDDEVRQTKKRWHSGEGCLMAGMGYE